MAKKAKAPRSAIRSVGEIDRFAGHRIRQLRLQMGMSQDDLAKAMGLSFQQIQKYEKGVNRLSIGRLIQMATLLQTTPHDIMGWDIKVRPANAFDADLFKLAQSFETLPDPLRTPIRTLIDALSKHSELRGKTPTRVDRNYKDR